MINQKPKKRILIVTRSYDHQIGGMETHTRLIIEDLVNNGHAVTVITPKLPTGMKPLFEIKGVSVYRISKFPNPTLKYSITFLRLVANFIKEHHMNYDRIISISVAAAFLNSHFIKKHNIKLMPILHGTYQLERSSLINQFFVTGNRSIKTLLGIPYCLLMEILQKRILRNAKYIISASTLITKNLNKHYPKFYRKIVTVKNFIDVNKFNFISRFKNPNKILNLLYVGRLHKEKGLDMVVNMIKYIELYDIPYRLDIVGGGEMLDYLSKEFKNNKKVHIHGPVENNKVATFLEKSDIFLFPTKRTGEGMSIAVLEAMSTGMVVVASNVPSMNELINNKNDGLLFNVGDQESFNNQIIWCNENYSKLRNISQQARKKIEKDHSLDNGLKIIRDTILK